MQACYFVFDPGWRRLRRQWCVHQLFAGRFQDHGAYQKWRVVLCSDRSRVRGDTNKHILKHYGSLSAVDSVASADELRGVTVGEVLKNKRFLQQWLCPESPDAPLE